MRQLNENNKADILAIPAAHDSAYRCCATMAAMHGERSNVESCSAEHMLRHASNSQRKKLHVTT